MLQTSGDLDPAGRRAVERLLGEGVCCSADYHDQTASTNTLALEDLRRNRIPTDSLPRLYLTDRQTSGRGRHGRDWQSGSGTLTFTLVVGRPGDSPRAANLMSLAVGVGVARSVEFEFAPLRAHLKWPNDVYVNGGKVAGILLETAQNAPGQVVVGVGVNVSDSPAVDQPASGLADVVGRQLHRYDVLESLVTHIVAAIADLNDLADSLVADFRTHCLLTGRVIRFQEGAVAREGTCEGVSDDGELMVQVESKRIHLNSGEASLVRPWSGDAAGSQT